MTACVRHLLRSVTALKDGRWIGAEGGIEGCGLARIREIYEIVNPASAVRTLRSGRPAGGYAAERCLALGDAMFRAEIVHTVSPDGTVVTDFDYRTLQNVPWQGFLGLMYQEKCRPENGSVRRYIPGLRPFRDGGRRYDFTVPRDIALPFPASFAAGPDTWEDPEYPPDRQIEMILSGRAGGCVAFAAGILPEGTGGRRSGGGTRRTPSALPPPASPTSPSGARPIRKNARGASPARGARSSAGITPRKGIFPSA